MIEAGGGLQDRINEFWRWRGNSGRPGDLSIRNDDELAVWMLVLTATKSAT